MEMGVQFTLTTPGPDITFNAGSGDEYLLDASQCFGFDQAASRITFDDAPQDDGAVVFDGFDGAFHLIMGGTLMNRTGTAAARNTMEVDLRQAIRALRNADGTLAWTTSGGTAYSLTVRREISVAYPPYPGYPHLKLFSFGLIAGDPTY